MSILHSFVSAKADSSDPTKVQPSHWNQPHVSMLAGIQYAPTAGGELTSASAASNYLDYFRRKFNASLEEVYEFAPFPMATNTPYIFPAQTPTLNLTAGITNTILLAPVPLGINAENKKHKLLITDAIGGNEVIEITGGTTVSGSESGTITFVPTLNHGSGNWNISSATAGIQEALYANPGSKIYLASGQIIVHGTIFMPKACSLIGHGSSTTGTSGPGTQIFFKSLNTPCIQVWTDHVMIRDLAILSDYISGTATLGSVGITTLADNGANFDAQGVIIEQINIQHMFDGVEINGGSNAQVSKIQCVHCRRDGFRMMGGGGYYSKLLSIANWRHGFYFSTGTHASGVAFCSGLTTFCNRAWGLYGDTGGGVLLSGIPSFFNNDSLGEIYLNVGGAGNMGVLSNVEIQWAGDNWVDHSFDSPTAPGLVIENNTGFFRVQNVQVYGSKGKGVIIKNSGNIFIGNAILGNGTTATAGHLLSLEIQSTGGSNLFVGNQIGGPVEISSGSNVFTGNYVSGSNPVAMLWYKAGQQNVINGNSIFNVTPTGKGIQIDAGVTYSAAGNISIPATTDNGTSTGNKWPNV